MFSLSSIPFSASVLPGCGLTTRAFDPATASPKTKYQTGEIATVDGQPVYRVPAQWVDDMGVDASVSIQSIHLPASPLPALSRIRLTGNVRVSAWDRDGRVHYTLTADGIEPLDAPSVSSADLAYTEGGETDDMD